MKIVSIVIPALNEKDGIEKTLKDIPKSELESAGYAVQILVVDGVSDDGTAELSRNAGAEVIVEQRRGYGRAYKTGFAQAKGNIIVTADADYTYPMKDILNMVRMLEEEKLDFILTSRLELMDSKAMSKRNKFGNEILALIVRILFRVKVSDFQSGMSIFRREILDNLKEKDDPKLFTQELKVEACCSGKYRWKQLSIKYFPRHESESKLGGWNDGFSNLFFLIKQRVTR